MTYRQPGPGAPSLMRQTLQSLFGFDLPTAQKWVIAFGVILVLLVLLGLFARQIKDGRLRIKGQGGGRTRQPRLGVVDIHDLDRQRQLVLIRRDNVEHLVMIGGPSDVVVETNIVRSGARTAMPAQSDLGLPDRPLPFDTLVPQELARQDAVRHEPAEDMRRAPPPAPVALAPSGGEPPQPPTRPVQPASRPVQTLTQAEAAVAAATAAGGGVALGVAAASKPQAAPPAPASVATASLAPSPVVQAPHFTRDPAPAASAGELDDMARQLDEALKRPFSAVRPANAPTAAPIPPVDAAPAPAELLPESAAAPPAPVAPPAQQAMRALPMDVEAELEMALGLKPERTGPKPPASTPPAVAASAFAAPSFTPPKPFEPAPPAEPEAVAAPEPDAVDASPEPESKPELDVEPEIRPEPQMDEVESEAKQADEAETRDPLEEAAAEDRIEEASPEPEPKPIDPFSVDAIEAEFARLLGRDSKTRP